MQHYLDFSLFFVIFVLKFKIRRNKQLYIKKILLMKKNCLKYLDNSKNNVIFVMNLKKMFSIETD